MLLMTWEDNTIFFAMNGVGTSNPRIYKGRCSRSVVVLGPAFLFIGEISPKSEKTNLKFENEVILEGFHGQKWEKRIVEIARFLYLGF